MIATIALDDGLILPHSANPTGSNFRERQEKIEAPKERAPAKVINLMDALRRSVEAERGGSAKRQAQPAKARGSESERKKKSR
jgi:hypothetical protein